MNHSPPVRLAVLFLLLTGGASLVIGVRALQVTPLPAPAEPAFLLPTAPEAVRVDDGDADVRIVRTVALNPFRPDRQRAEGRYVRSDVASETYVEPPPPMRLTGIARGGRRSLALIVADGQPARLTGVGDSIGPYRIARIESKTVWLAGPEADFALHLPDPFQPSGDR